MHNKFGKINKRKRRVRYKIPRITRDLTPMMSQHKIKEPFPFLGLSHLVRQYQVPFSSWRYTVFLYRVLTLTQKKLQHQRSIFEKHHRFLFRPKTIFSCRKRKNLSRHTVTLNQGVTKRCRLLG